MRLSGDPPRQRKFGGRDPLLRQHVCGSGESGVGDAAGRARQISYRAERIARSADTAQAVLLESRDTKASLAGGLTAVKLRQDLDDLVGLQNGVTLHT
jgi:hypothetical protein